MLRGRLSRNIKIRQVRNPEKFVKKGGFCEVYKISDSIAEKRLYKKDENSKKRFLAEIDNIKKIDHDNIIKIIDCDKERYAYTMPYYEFDYKRYLEHEKSRGLFPLKIFEKICKAVTYLHEKDIIHRDLKPGNILIGEKGEAVVIADFGLSKDLSTSSDLTRDGLGDDRFSAKELLKGEVTDDLRLDIYSLGEIVKYTIEVMDIESDDELEKIIKKATEDDIKKRYNSVEELCHSVINNTILGKNQVSKDMFLAIDYIERIGHIDEDLFWDTIFVQVSESENEHFERAVRKILSSQIVSAYFIDHIPEAFLDYIHLYCEMLRDRTDIYTNNKDRDNQNILVSELFLFTTGQNLSPKVKSEIWMTLIYIAYQAKLQGSYYIQNTIEGSVKNLESDIRDLIKQKLSDESQELKNYYIMTF